MGMLPSTSKSWLQLTHDSDPIETFPFDDFFSPVLHRIDSAVRFRATHPQDPLPSPSAVLTKFSQPPEEVIEKSQKHLGRLVDAADVKKGSFYAFSLFTN